MIPRESFDLVTIQRAKNQLRPVHPAPMLNNLTLSCWMGLSLLALAEEAPQHRLRLLAVGDPPPFVQTVRDGARYEVPPAAGTIPPRIITLPLRPPSRDSSNEQASVRLRLGQPSLPILLTAAAEEPLLLKREDGEKWLNVPLHRCGSTLALISRGGPSWNQARTVILPDDANARQKGKVHFANLTAKPMAVVFGTQKIRLESAKTFSRQLATDAAPIQLEIYFPGEAGSLKLCYSTTLEPASTSSHRLIVYAADGKSRRLPVKVLHLQENEGSGLQETASIP